MRNKNIPESIDKVVMDAVYLIENSEEDGARCCNYNDSLNAETLAERNIYTGVGCYGCDGYDFICRDYNVKLIDLLYKK